ncbi:MAG: FeoB-associated Cys-rich membrane protein [Vallitaleaceae bacterium]|nr:FeoB-associated Cys-rich membrane protein [Vallitaleaceae bacterium]
MGNIIVIIVLLAIFGAASYKIYKDKKNNVKCSGCPSYKANGTCSANHKESE